MSIYLNPDNKNFLGDLKKKIYVDKSLLIHEINDFIDMENKYICISRPRRFGKTMATNMLSAYYSKGCDSREAFSKLNISADPGFEEKLNKYNVIKIDVNSEYQNTNDKGNMLEILTAEIKTEMRELFPSITLGDELSLAKCILKIYEKTGETFILFLDEYDVLVREKVSESLYTKYLSFLNGLFKSDTVRNAISLVYITGILPVVRDRAQSKLNNFEEYTFLDGGVLSEYMGFTSDEVKSICEKYNAEFDECRRWYDGYRQNGFELYNPESVVKCIEKKRCVGYWSKTSTYKVIAERIAENFAGTKEAVIRMLSGESVDVRVTTYMNTMTDFSSRNDVFTYLIHIGYLAYDPDEQTCHIPNREIMEEWENAIAIQDEYAETNAIIEKSRDLLQATISGDEEEVARALDTSHIHVSSNRSYNNEDVLQSAIYLAYIYAVNKYTIVREMTAGKGFSDVTFIPAKQSDPALIIELKKNKTVESAINQICERKYFDSLTLYHGNLIFVGINYDEKEKTHTCKIERFVI